jgi:guanosine-3',5'-bis(diphosphate) 3'-pyrophosphohydrolase
MTHFYGWSLIKQKGPLLMPFFDSRYDEALALAARAHRLAYRKGSENPYIIHPVHVALILERAGFCGDILIAGLLHDVVEDTNHTIEEIEQTFGAEVARLVAALTEQKTDANGKKCPWKLRKHERMAQVRAAGMDAVALAAADMLHNISTTMTDVRRSGASVWQRFEQPDLLVWHYRQIATLVAEFLPNHALTQELEAAVEQIAVLYEP